MHIGRALKILREANDIHLQELAKKAEVSASMLSMIEKGHREPSISVARRLTDALGVPFDVLIAVSQPGEGTLMSSDKRTESFSLALRRLEDIHDELKNLSAKNAGEQDE